MGAGQAPRCEHNAGGRPWP